jgi:hypothetical protein
VAVTLHATRHAKLVAEEQSARPGAATAVHVALALFAVGIAISAWLEAGLAWDGSFYLAKVLQFQQPHVPFQRYSSEVFQWPVLFVGWYTRDLSVLRHVYAIALAVVPLTSLVASWWVTRKRAPWLMVWPILGIGLVVLPGMLFQVNESMMVAELTWPLLLLTLVWLDRRSIVFACLLVAFMMFLAAMAALAFVVVAAAALAKAVFVRERRWVSLSWSAALVAMAFVRYLALPADFTARSHQVSLGSLRYAFDVAERGWPLAACVLAWVAGALLLALPALTRRWGSSLPGWAVPVVRALPVALTTVAGLALVRWATDPRVWEPAASTFNVLALLLQVPLLAMGTLEVVSRSRRAPVRLPAPRQGVPGDVPGRVPGGVRGGVAVMAAATFAVVLSSNSWTWSNAVAGMKRRVQTARTVCVAPADAVAGQPLLNGWYLGSLALVSSPTRRPWHVVLPASGCTRLRKKGELELGGPSTGTEFAVHTVWSKGGWFSFKHLTHELSSASHAAGHAPKKHGHRRGT